MAVTEVIHSIAVILFMVLPGFVLGRIRYSDELCNGLSFFAVTICVPALIISSLQNEYSPGLMLGLGRTFAFWIPAILFAGALAFFLSRMLHFDRAQSALVFCMLACSNTGFVGIPLCLQLYGQESMFYAAACEIASDFFLFSVVFTSVALASGYKAELNPKTLFVNPPMVALFVGVVLFLARIRLPGVLLTPLNYFSGCAAPVSLFILGCQLSRLSVRDFLGDWRIYIVCAARLILIPLFAYVLVRVLFRDDTLFSRVFITMTGMPVASVTTTAAVAYHSDTEFAAKGVSLSTVLCLLTAPVWALIL